MPKYEGKNKTKHFNCSHRLYPDPYCQFYWGMINKLKLYVFGLVMIFLKGVQWDDLIYICYEMIITIMLINTSITLYTYHCVCTYMRKRKIYSLSKFQVQLLRIVILLYIGSPELIHLITGSLQPLTKISPFPYHPASGKHHSTL